ncbi:hypothetical protein QO010_001113 [Caulobacter ginsengisoli]|uniref:DUF3617 domain-containing protein n=1 Tax=Caulobacter ginsengisoli TaxID=400775 RepID=A0ABU0IMW3_9CAUL|nr:DUF3617 family protein [Caulobacter ginsengisoli]MDQ0463342.1 hypothetical protein [Caulobacter ginsengisoli]
MRPLVLTTAAACVLALSACKPGPDKAAGGSPDAKPAAPTMMAPTGDAAPPKVLAGLWEMKMDVEGAPKGLSAKACIDPAVQGEGAAYGQQFTKKDCSENHWNRVDGGMDFRSVCDIQGTHIATDGKVRGDFSSHYTVSLDSTMSRDGVTKTGKTVIDATRLGDCPSGMSPGDKQITMAGRTITIGADGRPKP